MAQVQVDTFLYTGAVQTFTVPPCVTTIHIEAYGAQGGAVTGYSPFPQGGRGAIMSGDFAVNPGDVLTVIVGGRGNSDPSSSGGGGGSGVNLNNTALIVAGGGGGVDFQDASYGGQDASTTVNGFDGNDNPGSGGIGGGSGLDYAYTSDNISRGGNGWNAGNMGTTGANGLSTATTFTNGSWGIGGGGGSVGYGYCNCGGGGGGYSGGGSASINASGGGGGSYNSGTNQVNSAGPTGNQGHGKVLITYTVGVGLPASPSSISGTSAVCEGGGPLTYSISPVANATGYTWTVSGNSSIISGQGTTSIDVQPGTGSSTITVTADNACGSSAPTSFTLVIQGLPTVTLGADTTQCGGTITLDALNPGDTYMWNDGSTNQTLVVDSTGAYSVNVTNANGCGASDTINVTINEIPVLSNNVPAMICLDDDIMMLMGTPMGGTWSGPGVSGTSFNAMTAGAGPHQLVYSYTDSAGCSAVDTTNITVDLCLGVTAANGTEFTVSPNPNNGSFVIEFGAAQNNTLVEIVDITGRTVQSNTVSGSRTNVNCESQPAGVYFVRVTANGNTTMKKITVVK